MAAQPSPSEFQPYRKVQVQAERDLRLALETTAKAISGRVARLSGTGISAQVRRAQLTATLAAIRRMQRSMWVGTINPAIKQGVDDAEKAAESAVEAMTRVAYASLPDGAAEALVRGLRLSAESGLASDAARRKRELSTRVYRQQALHEGKVEEIIRTGIQSALSAKEMADDVYKYVSPTTPGGASYAAMRLARTEINNAFHERQLAGATRPGVTGVKWNLSGSHKVPDLCNVYASHGGNGEWPPAAVPDKPHPQCFCFLTYITASPDEFRKRLAAGSFDDEIDRRTRENLARLGQKVGPIEPPKKAEVPAPKKTPRKTPAKASDNVVPIKPNAPATGSFSPKDVLAQKRLGPIEIQDRDGKWHRVDSITKAPGGGSRTGGVRGGQYNFRDPDGEKILSASPNELIKTRPFSEKSAPLTGQAAHDAVPKGLFKRGTMTPHQRKALQVYETGWFQVINGFLRGKRWKDSDYAEEKRDVDRIDSAMAESELTSDIQGWRGLFNARSLFGDRFDNDLTGFSWHELGYGSMTTQESVTRTFLTGFTDKENPDAKPVADAVKIKVTVAKGVQALETSTETKGSKANGPQAEITLQHDLSWKVVKDNGVDAEGVRHLEVEVNPLGEREAGKGSS